MLGVVEMMVEGKCEALIGSPAVKDAVGAGAGVDC